LPCADPLTTSGPVVVVFAAGPAGLAGLAALASAVPPASIRAALAAATTEPIRTGSFRMVPPLVQALCLPGSRSQATVTRTAHGKRPETTPGKRRKPRRETTPGNHAGKPRREITPGKHARKIRRENTAKHARYHVESDGRCALPELILELDQRARRLHAEALDHGTGTLDHAPRGPPPALRQQPPGRVQIAFLLIGGQVDGALEATHGLVGVVGPRRPVSCHAAAYRICSFSSVCSL
jgi:hypothetical protein